MKVTKTFVFTKEEIIEMIERKHNLKLDPAKVKFSPTKGVVVEVEA